MAKRGIRREMWRQASTSPYLLLLFVTSILLSLASFYTTYEGIAPFVRFAVIALFITIAIQSLLFVVSWRLGFMFAGKEDVARADMGVFVVCFLLSVFFSFNSLFNMIFVEERQREASLGRARDGATLVVNDVERLLKDIRARRVDDLRKSDDYATWRRDVLAIADAAQRTDPRLREKVARQRARKQEEYERKAEEARNLVAREGTMQGEIAAMERQLEAIESAPPDNNLEDLRRQVRELELKISAKRAEMDAEEQGIAESGKSGRGYNWYAKEREHRILVNQLEDLQGEIEIRGRQLDNYEQRRRELTEKLTATKELYANIDTEIEHGRAEAKSVWEELESFGSGSVTETVQALREYPNRFEERLDVGRLKQAEGLCTRLADEMKDLGMELGGKSCDRGPIMDKVAPIVETGQVLGELDRQCLGADAPSFHGMAFVEALAAARHCLDLSRLPYRQVRELREDLDRLEREEGPNASEFTKTTNALFAGEKDGYLALILAVAMDLLVLFTGLIGAKSATATFAVRVLDVDRQDDPEVAAIKTLLKHLEPFDRKIGGTRYGAKIDLEKIPDVHTRDAVGSLLVRNLNTGLVLASADESDRYFLRYDTQEQLENQLEQRRRTATGQRRYAPRSPTRKPGPRVRGRSPFYAAGERSLDHPGSRSTAASDSAAAGPVFDPYAGKPEGGFGGSEPGAQAGPGETPVSPADAGALGPGIPPAVDAEPARDAPVSSTGSGSEKSDEDLELVYGFLQGNEPGKPSSEDP